MNIKKALTQLNPIPWIAVYQVLKKRGIMGMNCRNRRYIARYNKRSLYPLVDDKLQTKKLALEHGVNVPGLLGVIRQQHDIADAQTIVEGANGFCIKPAQGSGGKGILVVLKGEDGRWQRTDGRFLPPEDIERHLSNILAGIFSLGGKSDVAIVEELIQVDPVFKEFTHEGVPDLRIIIFRGYPVMAMMRLSCHASKGKANLHQGAVGVGINIANGSAVNAVQKGVSILRHPDTQQLLSELVVPHWEQMLRLACACYDMTGLGYIGVDLVLDKHKGPLLLELNARPGLAIQVANNAGLLPRLRKVEVLSNAVSIDERIEFVRNNFGQA
ncbi:MAG: alpha-L-glutamate ligase-like protein [Marinagarivorans sp.]|nr:alpha-L-glutamate ligase-like protein [Marinagarivorans sp.]